MLGAIPPLTAMLDESGCGSCGDVDAAGSKVNAAVTPRLPVAEKADVAAEEEHVGSSAHQQSWGRGRALDPTATSPYIQRPCTGSREG
uniref:Uncharacterized protein n=1 Tax=Oryza meridionalis TaxID=40149 RepID=A0A0E0ES71_9ORYZ